MEQINEYEIDGLLKTMEGLGINGLIDIPQMYWY